MPRRLKFWCHKITKKYKTPRFVRVASQRLLKFDQTYFCFFSCHSVNVGFSSAEAEQTLVKHFGRERKFFSLRKSEQVRYTHSLSHDDFLLAECLPNGLFRSVLRTRLGPIRGIALRYFPMMSQTFIICLGRDNEKS